MDVHKGTARLPQFWDPVLSEWALWYGARGRTTRMRSDARGGTVAVVTICGEIDGANAEAMGRYLRSVVCVRRPLVVDLTAVTFLGARGVGQLVALDAACEGAGAPWVLAANVVLRRLLVRVGAGDGAFAVSGSLREALQLVVSRAPST